VLVRETIAVLLASVALASCCLRLIDGLDEMDAGISCLRGVPAEVTTLAGGGDGGALSSGVLEARASQVSFTAPTGVALDISGNVYVSDMGYIKPGGIDRIDSAGNIFLLTADVSPGNEGIAVDATGNVYVANSLFTSIEVTSSLFQGILKVDPSGNVTTLAGNEQAGYADGSGGDNGTARFHFPSAVAVDASGSLFVADTANNRIRKIDTSGNVTTLAGDGDAGFADGTGGPRGTAQFNFPTGVVVDASGNLYVADEQNNSIRKLDPSGNVTTLAGHPDPGSMYPNVPSNYGDGTGGPDGTARFLAPWGVALDGSGNVYVADYGNGRVRKVDANGNVTTLAGNGTQGFADGTLGPSGTAELDGPVALAVDACGRVYVADFQTQRIRLITP